MLDQQGNIFRNAIGNAPVDQGPFESPCFHSYTCIEVPCTLAIFLVFALTLPL